MRSSARFQVIALATILLIFSILSSGVNIACDSENYVVFHYHWWSWATVVFQTVVFFLLTGAVARFEEFYKDIAQIQIEETPINWKVRGLKIVAVMWGSGFGVIAFFYMWLLARTESEMVVVPKEYSILVNSVCLALMPPISLFAIAFVFEAEHLRKHIPLGHGVARIKTDSEV